MALSDFGGYGPPDDSYFRQLLLMIALNRLLNPPAPMHFNPDAALDPSQVEDRRPQGLTALLNLISHGITQPGIFNGLDQVFAREVPLGFVAPTMAPEYHDQTYYPASAYQYFEDNSRRLLPPPEPAYTPAPEYHDNSADVTAIQNWLAAMPAQSMAAPNPPPPAPGYGFVPNRAM